MISKFLDINYWLPNLSGEGKNLFEIMQNIAIQPFILYVDIAVLVFLNIALFFAGFMRISSRKGKVIRKKLFMGSGLFWIVWLVVNIAYVTCLALLRYFPIYTSLLK